MKGYLNIKVSYGSAKIVKTSEDGKVEGISFTITGNGVNKTVQTGEGGVIQIDIAMQEVLIGAVYIVFSAVFPAGAARSKV